ncbi:MAG: uroporphyrinogen-III C-methyltransferase, partial [Lentisphaerae bacterium]|nr:uroporphyrinogen-III C-methyltransferase [Lentisphaerota bacterium]
LLPIRGDIEDRLAQLDAGAYDLALMAGAALRRLGLDDRIAEWIPLADLLPPEGQGVLALTFRAGDPFFLRLRSLFVKAVAFVGAGTGDAAACTLAGLSAMRRCEVCLHDSLLDSALLEALPNGARRFDVGKRCGQHALSQSEISALIATETRKGYSVVRLKGGDPGLFGRLAEEIEELDRLHLPYRVIPGVSSLNAATTGTGMLLTRRGLSRGFCVLTPRQQGGTFGPVTGQERARLPVVFFMAAGVVKEVAQQLIGDGTPQNCPAAMVFNAGSDDETVIRAEIGRLAAALAGRQDDLPGVLIVGEVTAFGFRKEAGAFAGRRILLTCSRDLQDKAADQVHDLGGVPVRRPLIRLTPNPEALECVRHIGQYDWVVLTSPAAVRCFNEIMEQLGTDARAIPKLMAGGPGTSGEMRKFRLMPEAEPPENFGAGGLRQTAGDLIKRGDKVLRLRSDKAGGELAEALSRMGGVVDDCILYRNEAVTYDALPEFDAAFFASGSAVEAFDELWGKEALKGKTILAIGQPTVAVLKAHGLSADVIGPEPTVEASLATLAGRYVRQALGDLL